MRPSLSKLLQWEHKETLQTASRAKRQIFLNKIKNMQLGHPNTVNLSRSDKNILLTQIRILPEHKTDWEFEIFEKHFKNVAFLSFKQKGAWYDGN